ncbi:hypothetical protein ABK040_006103 [Willaertia magna]
MSIDLAITVTHKDFNYPFKYADQNLNKIHNKPTFNEIQHAIHDLNTLFQDIIENHNIVLKSNYNELKHYNQNLIYFTIILNNLTNQEIKNKYESFILKFNIVDFLKDNLGYKFFDLGTRC